MELAKIILFKLAAVAVTILMVEAGKRGDGDLFLARLALLTAMFLIAFLDDRLKELREESTKPPKKEPDKD